MVLVLLVLLILLLILILLLVLVLILLLVLVLLFLVLLLFQEFLQLFDEFADPGSLLFLSGLKFFLLGDLGGQGGGLFFNEVQIVPGVLVVRSQFQRAFEIVDGALPERFGDVLRGESGFESLQPFRRGLLPLFEESDRALNLLRLGIPTGFRGTEQLLARLDGRSIFPGHAFRVSGHLGRSFFLEALRSLAEPGIAQIVERVRLKGKVFRIPQGLREALGRTAVVALFVEFRSPVEPGDRIARLFADRPGKGRLRRGRRSPVCLRISDGRLPVGCRVVRFILW